MRRAIYCVGDVHLGRRPSGLASALELSPALLGPEEALARTVRRAIDEKARAVIFAGDLVDDARDRFEAFRPLEQAVRTLCEAGVAVFGVAGNHDHLALPRLASRIPDFTLLGEGGRWALCPLPAVGDDPPVDLLGWSFPAAHVGDDPTLDPSLETALEARRDGARLLGVIHGDLDRPGSPFAPLDGGRLATIGADAFLLGHIHTPGPAQRLGPEGGVGYLGSLCALDAGEPGHHGPWRLGYESGAPRLEHLPLSPLRFEALTLELDDASAESPETLLDAIAARARGLVDEGSSSDDLKLLALRCTLRGRLRDRRPPSAFAALSPGERTLRVGEVQAVVERVIDQTLPARDLALLAEAPTPVGHLARRILALQAGEAGDLLLEARARIAPFVSGRWALDSRPPPAQTPAAADALDPSLDARLLAAAIDALDHLLREPS